MPRSGFAGGFRIAVFTAGAGVGDVAVLGAGRRCFYTLILMSQRRKNLNIFDIALSIEIAAADLAQIVFIQSGLGTGRLRDTISRITSGMFPGSRNSHHDEAIASNGFRAGFLAADGMVALVNLKTVVHTGGIDGVKVSTYYAVLTADRAIIRVNRIFAFFIQQDDIGGHDFDRYGLVNGFIAIPVEFVRRRQIRTVRTAGIQLLLVHEIPHSDPVVPVFSILRLQEALELAAICLVLRHTDHFISDPVRSIHSNACPPAIHRTSDRSILKDTFQLHFRHRDRHGFGFIALNIDFAHNIVLFPREGCDLAIEGRALAFRRLLNRYDFIGRHNVKRKEADNHHNGQHQRPNALLG